MKPIPHMVVRRGLRRVAGAYGVGVGIAAPSLATGAIAILNHYVAVPNISLVYVPAILVTAVYFGTGPSLLAATIAVVEYDFFLLRPLFTFNIAQVGDILAFGVFMIVAVLTSQLAAGTRARAEAAQRRATESRTLYELGQALMSGGDVLDVLRAMTERIVAVFGVDRCSIFVPDADDRLRLAAESPEGQARNRTSLATTSWVFQRGTEVRLPVEGDLPEGQRRIYVPLRTADRVVGVMEIGPKASGEALDATERQLVTSFAAQAALVIARAESDEERRRLTVLEESDKLKSALLSAVSHDLRTPLASIKASATSLLLSDAAWRREEGREFLEAIDHEADHLNRLVGNLLDLSRIEAGVLRPVLDWYDVQELVDLVAPRLRPMLANHPFTIDVPSGIPPVRIDLVRIEELVLNLVENAVTYTPPNCPICLSVRTCDSALIITVVDHGPGVPSHQRQRIFETFHRSRVHGDRDHGTGLGLAICRGIAEAHLGTIRVEDTPGGGATFVLTLPGSVAEALVEA
ncbi:MAG: ATP-binding protein [Chloroflexota bacterium]